MNRFRLYPTPEQESGLIEYCAQARFIWNLALEQHNWYGRAGRRHHIGYIEQARQLTELRREHEWLRRVPCMVHQQALRDLHQAWSNYFAGTHRRPTWRKAGRHEGFRIVCVSADSTKNINRRWAQVWVPKIGWLKLRRSHDIPDAKSYRVTRDPSGAWYIAYASPPDPIPAPGTGEIIGIDRGITASFALSTGEMFHVPGLRVTEQRRKLRLERRLARAKRGSNRRCRVKVALAKLRLRERQRRKGFIEQITTGLARRYDVIRVENLNVKNMTRSAKGTADAPGTNVRAKSGLNRSILAQGWTLFVRRLEDKAPGRVEKIPSAFTSQRCSCCGVIDREARESQAVFRCRACGYNDNADINAAKNVAAGWVVPARGGLGLLEPMNREPEVASLKRSKTHVEGDVGVNQESCLPYM